MKIIHENDTSCENKKLCVYDDGQKVAAEAVAAARADHAADVERVPTTHREVR